MAGRYEPTGAEVPRRCAPDAMEWRIDPTILALRESAWREALPRPFCIEVGRRVLLAELEFSEWVLRRVEKVEFERDRNVSRRISIDLCVRADAPIFVDAEGTQFWLLPVSVMRRRTLVNLDIRDEAGESITMLGLRLAQRLDESVLRAAAVLAIPGEWGDLKSQQIDRFITELVAGNAAEAREAMDRAMAAPNDSDNPFHALLTDPVFSGALARLRRNFTLYAMLPVAARRHRLLRMSFDEPTDWGYQKPTLEPLPKGENGVRYRAGRPTIDEVDEPAVSQGRWYRPASLRRRARRRWDRIAAYWARRNIILAHMAAGLGIFPTRVRFQIPGAENAASYHFEITAPHGVRIVKATLLAGRPNDPDRHVSLDDVRGHQPTVGLHAVEIPNGSLCRAQVDLRVPTRGWLTTVLLSCIAISAVLTSVWWHLRGSAATWPPGQLTNVVLLLVTVSGASATFVAQRDAGGVAARLVTLLRAVGAVAIALPAAAAAFLVYTARAAEGSDSGFDATDRKAVAFLSCVSIVLLLLIAVAWVRTRWAERRSVEQRSPWDQTRKTRRELTTNFNAAIQEFGFDTAAVGIQSAEGWHERYSWTDAAQLHAVKALQGRAMPINHDRNASGRDPAAGCTCTHACAIAHMREGTTDTSGLREPTQPRRSLAAWASSRFQWRSKQTAR